MAAEILLKRELPSCGVKQNPETVVQPPVEVVQALTESVVEVNSPEVIVQLLLLKIL